MREIATKEMIKLETFENWVAILDRIPADKNKLEIVAIEQMRKMVS